MSTSTPSDANAGAITMADWEYVLGDMDRGYSNIFTGIYGGKECGEDPGPFASITAEYTRDHKQPSDPSLVVPPPSDMHDLSPEAWSASSGEFAPKQEPTTQSVLSYSGESSVEDNMNPFTDLSVRPDDMNFIDPFHPITMPPEEENGEFALANGWDRRLAV